MQKIEVSESELNNMKLLMFASQKTDVFEVKNAHWVAASSAQSAAFQMSWIYKQRHF